MTSVKSKDAYKIYKKEVSFLCGWELGVQNRVKNCLE